MLWQNPVVADIYHQGGDLNFGTDGTLYFSVGDHLDASSAQSLSSANGKILRINRDGTAPADNPFYDGSGPNVDAIWARGLRNPFRFTIDPPTGRMIIADVGQNDWEELDVGVRGANYGWPTCEGTCSASGMTNPAYTYRHVSHDASVTGGFVYRGSQFGSGYQGDYFFADYAQNWIKRLTFDANGNVAAVRSFEPLDGSLDGPYGDVVGLAEGPDGALYYVDAGPFEIAGQGAIRRIRNVSANQPPVAAATVSDGTLSASSDPLTITVGTPPTATIATPSNGRTFRAGEAIAFSGSGTDPDGGPVTLTWKVVFHHDGHIHPVLDAAGGSGSFTVPTSGHSFQGNTNFELVLTATDADGIQTSTSVTLVPEKARLSVATSPSGLALTLDGISQTPPVSYDELVGFQRSVDTPSPQFVGASRYTFGAWSDGGARAHAFTVPAGGLALTATFTLADQGPSGLVAAYGFDEGNGSTLRDASGKSHNGTLSGPVWAGAGRNGGALQFDGVNDFVRVDDHADLDLTGAMTLEAWVRPSAQGTNWRTVLFKEQASHMTYALYANSGSGQPAGQAYVGGQKDARGTAAVPANAATAVRRAARNRSRA
jgi:hypothetical protein